MTFCAGNVHKPVTISVVSTTSLECMTFQQSRITEYDEVANNYKIKPTTCLFKLYKPNH